MNTIQSTLENNKLIAEFMGKDIGHENMIIFTKNWEVMKYHNDWNWLMQVVEKIESLEYDVNIEFATCIILKNVDDFKPIFGHGSNFSKIGAVYNACVEFIKWYNQNKQD